MCSTDRGQRWDRPGPRTIGSRSPPRSWPGEALAGRSAREAHAEAAAGCDRENGHCERRSSRPQPRQARAVALGLVRVPLIADSRAARTTDGR
jgi:hypothetical protein